MQVEELKNEEEKQERANADNLAPTHNLKHNKDKVESPEEHSHSELAQDEAQEDDYWTMLQKSEAYQNPHVISSYFPFIFIFRPEPRQFTF